MQFSNHSQHAKYFGSVISTMLVSIMLLFFFYHERKISIVSEEQAVNQMLSTIRMAIQFSVFKKMVQGGDYSLREYTQKNPMSLLSKLPVNYIGEVNRLKQGGVPDGSWYYDTQSQELVYRYLNTGFFKLRKIKESRFQLNYMEPGLIDRYNGVHLALVQVN